MTNWLISANGKMYDHAASFEKNGLIDWRQNKTKYCLGDTVYIYCTKPLSRVMFRCLVEEEGLLFSEIIDDREFWIIPEEYEKAKAGKYVRLRLLEQVDTPLLGLEQLKRHGLKAAPQGPMRINDVLDDYLQSHFNDYYAEGFFPDVDTTKSYSEGHCKRVTVNKYERSSIARRECIKYFGGARCAICDLDFGEKYGDFAEGFIHVHHLIPLHTIGKDYKVNYKTDLIPVCPNCHAMIHRLPGGGSMGLSELREHLAVH